MPAADWYARQVSVFSVLDALDCGDGGPEETRQRLCPVHADTRPSARVYAEPENRVYCFTCGEGWDVVGLVMAVKGLPFADACTWLDETFGLSRTSDLAARVKAALRASTPPPVAPLFTMAERALRSARGQLSLDQFARIAMAIDTVQSHYQAHPDSQTAQRDLRRILTAIRVQSSR